MQYPAIRIPPSGQIAQYPLGDAGKALCVGSDGKLAPIFPFNTATQVTYCATGDNDQTALNALMAAEAAPTGLKRKVNVVPGVSATFDCDVDAIIPSGTTLVYSSALTITGTGCPFAVDNATTQALGKMTAQNTKFANTITCDVSIPVGTLIGLELASGTALNDSLCRFQYKVIDCTGAGPYTIKLDRPIWVVLAANTEVVEITSRQHDIVVDGGGCNVGVINQKTRGLYAQDVTVKNFNGTAAGSNSAFIGCRNCSLWNIDDQSTPFFAASENCHGVLIRTHDINGPACVMDDCFNCTFQYSEFGSSINGANIGSNILPLNDSGCWRCYYLNCVASNNTQSGFDVVGGCADCGFEDCTAEYNGAIGFYLTPGGAYPGPKGTKIIRPTTVGNPAPYRLDGGGTDAPDTTIVDMNTIDGSVSTVEHKCTVRGGKGGPIELKAGSFDFTIQDVTLSSATSWLLYVNANCLGTVRVLDCPEFVTAGATNALVIGANANVVLRDTKLTAPAQAIGFTETGATLWLEGHVFLNAPAEWIGAAGNYFSRASGQLVTGVLTVAFPKLKSTDFVSVTVDTPLGTAGNMYKVTKTAGVGFVITSVSTAGATVATDTTYLTYAVSAA